MAKSTLEQSKTALRQAMLAQRDALPLEYIKSSSIAICKKLTAMPEWENANTVFIYIGVGNEIATTAAITNAFEKEKRVCVPLCHGNGIMTARQIASLNKLHQTPRGLLEPDASALEILPDEIDLIVVPCIAADKTGIRLGYGGGYYDRYLSTTFCPTVCLCRSGFIYETLPATPFDIPVNTVLCD